MSSPSGVGPQWLLGMHHSHPLQNNVHAPFIQNCSHWLPAAHLWTHSGWNDLKFPWFQWSRESATKGLFNGLQLNRFLNKQMIYSTVLYQLFKDVITMAWVVGWGSAPLPLPPLPRAEPSSPIGPGWCHIIIVWISYFGV